MPSGANPIAAQLAPHSSEPVHHTATRLRTSCDFLIVGAGLAGLVVAERLSNQLGKRCIVIDKRSHVGGNAYDEYDAAGVLVHRYGPHYFRTNSEAVVRYLSRFTEWRPVEYKIKSYTDGRYLSFPINLNTFEELLGRPSTTREMEEYLAAKRVPIQKPRNSEEVIVSQVGWELYEIFFRGYTLKQWQREPKDLDASVCGRIPIRTNRDDRYFNESFQALPKCGYTEMFKSLLESSPGVQVWLNTAFEEAKNMVKYRHLVFTGPIDEFYGYRFGVLPYRTMRFERQSFGPAELEGCQGIAGESSYWQPAMQVNYPNSEPFTRIVEIKHATGQQIAATTIVREYPEPFSVGKEPHYPVPAPDAMEQYRRYKELADAEHRVSFIGRLGRYRYYNMDQVVGMALAEARRLAKLSDVVRT